MKHNNISINRALIWDYEFDEGKLDTNEFKKWYIERVLSSGTIGDIRNLGIKTVKQYFSVLNLPNKIRKFWEWYFNYANIH